MTTSITTRNILCDTPAAGGYYGNQIAAQGTEVRGSQWAVWVRRTWCTGLDVRKDFKPFGSNDRVTQDTSPWREVVEFIS
ncbi:MAG: hypothetical protein CMJ82_13720 [Planctomycetaceae bacterium]|nr:hypothetical protein [Planctomycetaceae bacterium]